MVYQDTVFKLEKPDLAKANAKKVTDAIIAGNVDVIRVCLKCGTPKYLYWDKAKYLPTPNGFSSIDIWGTIKVFRKISSTRVKSLVRDKNGEFFNWDAIHGLDEFLHYCTQKLGGTLLSSIPQDSYEKKRLILDGLMEEAIASSQLEGANTTRKAGKKLLREGRKPRTESERMIANNYKVMLLLENKYRNTDLDIDLLKQLHHEMMKDTINTEDLGRLRRNKDNVRIEGRGTGVIYHVPPDHKILNKEIVGLIDYFNGKLTDSQFVHPMIKAIVIHFWVGYLHPFVDGNGRLARALFYWSLLKAGYWAITYIPLSTLIRKSPDQYRDAFAYSEQDDNDLNYFIDYNIRKIRQAVTEFDAFIERRATYAGFFARGRSRYGLNHRQLELLRYYHKNPDASTTIKTHANVSQVTRMTARKDLRKLEELGLVVSRKMGRETPFLPTKKTFELFD